MRNILRTTMAAVFTSGLYAAFLLPTATAQEAEFIMPELSELAQQGEQAYNNSCATCHGVNLAGTDNGPAFLHPVYAAGHHSDMAFILAARRGVRAHHWRFGDMPAQLEISDEDLGAVITYIREIQAANGF